MKKIVFLGLILISLLPGCAKKEPLSLPPTREVGIARPITKPGTDAFRGGEKLTFGLKYLYIIPAGTATMEVREMSYQGRETYGLTLRVEPSGIIAFFIQIDGTIKSYLDAQRLETLRFEEHSIIGRHLYDRFITYDHKRQIAKINMTSFDERGEPVGVEKKKVKIPSHTQDILSSLYYLRTREFEENKILDLKVNERKHNSEVKLKVQRKEKVEVPVGSFLAWTVTPISIHKGKESYEKAKVTIWFTADKRKLPIKMIARTKLGAISMSLIDIRL